MLSEAASDPKFTFAFQPIVDVSTREIVSYEALIRGNANEPAYRIMQQVGPGRMHAFDERARIVAIGLAASLGISSHLNLNFLPLSLYSSDSAILTTIEAATQANISLDRIVLEVTEEEVIDDQIRFAQIMNYYRASGLQVSIDDFGTGYSGLNLLANFQPDQIKLDMKLVRGIQSHGPRQAIVRAAIQVCRDLGIEVIAEGVETNEEYTWLANAGVQLFQGYLFAKPGFASLPAVNYPGAPTPENRTANLASSYSAGAF